MEGIIDFSMREIFAQIGGVDRLVTEFIRVTDQVLPERVFTRYCPEINSPENSPKPQSHSDKLKKTEQSGLPVYIQLLGDNPQALALNAQKAASMGASGIDLNFGCPAKTVNRSCGGAYLLQWPDQIYNIVKTVREKVPASTPVTSKVRLGFKDKSLAQEIISACSEGGSSEIAIHARTKSEGYKPPAHWYLLADLHNYSQVPIIANGEMWSTQDIHDCMQKSQTKRIMLGRGLVAAPDLALFAKNNEHQAFTYSDIILLINYYYHILELRCPAKYRHSIIKQWMTYLRLQYAQIHLLFNDIKRIRQTEILKAALHKAFLEAEAQYPSKHQLGGLDLQAFKQEQICLNDNKPNR